MNLENNAPEEETYYNSESEGKEFNRKEISKCLKKIYKEREQVYEDYFYAPENYGTWKTQTENNTQSDETFINTCEETYGKKNCHEETYGEDFWEDYNKNTAEEKNNPKQT
jgi:hypothetical protein